MLTKQHYLRELCDNLDYVPTWLPTISVAAGEIGFVRDYEYKRFGNLRDFGIKYEITQGKIYADLEYSSADSVAVTLKLMGQMPPVGSVLSVDELGLSIDFSRANAVVFRAAGCQSQRLDNLFQIGMRVLELHKVGKWPQDAVVVTEAVHAASATIVISSGQKAHLDLRAGTVDPGNLHVASVDARLQIAREDNIGMKIIAQSALTPLMRVAGVQTRLMRSPAFRGSEVATTKIPEVHNQNDELLRFEDVSYEDYELSVT